VTFALLSLLVSLAVFCTCCHFLKLHTTKWISPINIIAFSHLHERRCFGVFSDKKTRIMKCTFLKRVKCKYLCKFRKPFFSQDRALNLPYLLLHSHGNCSSEYMVSEKGLLQEGIKTGGQTYGWYACGSEGL